MNEYLDACAIINLMKLGCWGPVLVVPVNGYHVTENVVREIREAPQARLLSRTLATGRIKLVSLAEIAELKLYGELKVRLGDGEAATLAAAAFRGGSVASDEKGRFLREAERVLGEGRVLRTPELVAAAVRYGTVTLDRLRFKVGQRMAIARQRRQSLEAEHLAFLLRDVEDRLAGESAGTA